MFSGGAWGSVPEDFDTFMAQLIEQGLAFQADTIEELAEKAGLPVDAFTATITAYNEGCATGNDPFGRTEQLVPMENGPFYAVPDHALRDDHLRRPHDECGLPGGAHRRQHH